MLLFLAWVGRDYYPLGRAERLGSPLHARLKSAGPWGHGVGIAARLFMLSNFLYALRKHWKRLERLGSIRRWLDFHVFVGFMSPLVIAFHAAFQSNNLLASGTAGALAIVMTTGFVGRFIYGVVPSERGKAEELEDLLGRFERIRDELSAGSPAGPAAARLVAHVATAACQREESTAEYLAKEMKAVSQQQQQQQKTIDSLNQRIAEHQDEEKTLQAKNAEYTHSIAEHTIALTHHEERLAVLREAHARSRSQIDDEKNRLIDLLTGLASRTNHLTQLEKNHLSLLRKIDYTREESLRLSRELLATEEHLAELLDEHQRQMRLDEDHRSELSRLENRIAEIAAELGQTEVLCNESREQYEKLNSRLTSLQELHDKFEECENGVRSIMLRTGSGRDAAAKN